MNADTLVVGGGIAGAVIAGRLVERTNAQVILLEAGPTQVHVSQAMAGRFARCHPSRDVA